MPRVGLLWRREWDPPPDGDLAGCRLHGVFAAFAALGVAAEPVVYDDDSVDAVREQLLRLDGVLVWVNPIEQGRDRSQLDSLLREVAAAGVWVSAHPDVILALATKKVLVDTQTMSWSAPARLYRSLDELRGELAAALRDGPRVLKQQRGMGGQGVWKIELETEAPDPWLCVRQATRDAPSERLRLSELADRCAPYFANGGLMVEQRYQERIADGMVRVYLSHDRVVGFAHQYPAGLRPESAGEPPPGKAFELPGHPDYARLRALMEQRWLPELRQLLDLETHALPVIWDADFLYGPRNDAGADTYVLCEINASSTFAFPEHAMPAVAQAALDRIAASPLRREDADFFIRYSRA